MYLADKAQFYPRTTESNYGTKVPTRRYSHSHFLKNDLMESTSTLEENLRGARIQAHQKQPIRLTVGMHYSVSKSNHFE